MGRVVLFSPIGGTDPISNSNYHDGALLHISRVFKPDRIYLYMSKEIIDKEEKDNRFTYCLSKLYERINKPLDYVMIKRPDLIEVHDFDYFYEDYRCEINKISDELAEDDELIVNISSGTPAMKSSLVFLATLGEINVKMIQVSTPEKKMNTHVHPDFIEELWECDEDNRDDFVNRCTEVHCQSLALINNENVIKKMIRHYDYDAALQVVQMLNEEDTKDYIHHIEYACERLKLNYSEVSKLENTYGIKSYIPVRESKYRDAVEYALTLFIKEKRGEYGDFVRGLTPLILELFILVLEKQTKVNARDFCDRDLKTTGFKWNVERLKQCPETREWLNILNRAYPSGGFNPVFLLAVHLLYVIKEKCSPEIVKKTELLREVEENVRNNAAHEIKCVTAESVFKLTNYTCKDIIDTIKSISGYAGIRNADAVWSSYDLMNEDIIKLIGKRNS